MAEPLSIDVVVESPRWHAHPGAETVVRRALCEAATAVSTKPSELAIVLTNDSAIRVLNRKWRKIDKPTNVLSFPMHTSAGGNPAESAGALPPVMLGDIVIAYETAAREARSQSKPFNDHLVHLAVHGFLHLLGHDHVSDRDAEIMEAIERAVLARLGIPDPYAAPDCAATAAIDA